MGRCADKRERVDEQEAKEERGIQFRRKRQNVKIYVIISSICVLLFVTIKFVQYKGDIEKYPSEKLEGFLEYTFEQDCHVTLDTYSYFMTLIASDDIPYIVDVTLKDGTETFFTATWERGVSVDYGVCTDYGEKLVKYYGRKYGIDYVIERYWFEIMLTEEDMAGSPSAIEQFMTDLYDSSYVQAGQDIELHIKTETSLSYDRVVLDGTEPFDVEAVIEELTR